MTEVPETETIQLGADGPLASEMPHLLALAIRRARNGGITRLLDGSQCVAEIRPPVAPHDLLFHDHQHTGPGHGGISHRHLHPHDVGDFRGQLEALINACSIENTSNTPDFVLASFLSTCLDAFNGCIVARDEWYRVKLSPGDSHFIGSPEE
jgi:hypothetical protein